MEKSDRQLGVALITDVFHGAEGPERLLARLREAREQGGELAVLPELPLDPWIPATRTVRDEDAEPPGGRRHRTLAEAARRAGIGVVGGVVVVDAVSGERRNRALAFDASGELAAFYDKLHLPSEEGYWESDHYRPGLEPPRPIQGFGPPVGIQICSDVQRPTGCLLLAAQGAEAILSPRATPGSTYERWRRVMRADALTSCAYLVSVNRPRSEPGVEIGGPSIAVAPGGEVLLETGDPVRVVRLEGAAVDAARREYPGYLAVRADLYGDAWSEVARAASR